MNKLFRSRNNRVVAGVCGGIAEMFNWEVSIVRIITFLICALSGMGVLVYILAAVIIPEDIGYIDVDSSVIDED